LKVAQAVIVVFSHTIINATYSQGRVECNRLKHSQINLIVRHIVIRKVKILRDTCAMFDNLQATIPRGARKSRTSFLTDKKS